MATAEPRYFVDRRVGIIYVIDRVVADSDDEDTDGVVASWSGKRTVAKCPTCKHENEVGWEIPEEYIEAANQRCEELNALEIATHEHL